jgi:tetratricopeptide (TPR) repeat protein
MLAAALAAGAALGGLAPLLLGIGPAFSAASLAAGAVGGLLVFLAAASRAEAGTDGSGFELRTSLVLTALALTVAHFVELQFGIAIAVTRLYLWFMLGVLVVAGSGWLEDAPPPPSRDRRRSARSTGGGLIHTGAALAGLLCVPAALSLIYGFMANWSKAAGALALVDEALFPTTGPATVRAAFWIAGWLVALLLARQLGSGDDTGRGRWTLGFAVTSLGLPGLYLVLQSARLSWPVRARAAGAELTEMSEYISLHFSALMWSLLVATVVVGVGIALQGRVGGTASRGSLLRVAASTIIIGVAGALLIARVNLDPMRADALLKHAESFIEIGRTEAALELLARAESLAPFDPLYPLQSGGAAMTAANAAGRDIERRRSHYLDAQEALIRARSLAPFEPDHTANLARLQAVRRAFAADAGERSQFSEWAELEYKEALRMRPYWPPVIREYAALLGELGRVEEARELIRRSRIVSLPAAAPRR